MSLLRHYLPARQRYPLVQKWMESTLSLGFGCQLHPFHQMMQLTDASPERFHPYVLLLPAEKSYLIGQSTELLGPKWEGFAINHRQLYQRTHCQAASASVIGKLVSNN